MNEMRDEFEKLHAQYLGLSLKYEGGVYDDHIVESAWETWQAALKSIPRISEAMLDDVMNRDEDVRRIVAKHDMGLASTSQVIMACAGAAARFPQLVTRTEE